MSIFVLVHGAYHGGWCWRDTATVLLAQGHTVYCPSLTGLGDRVHLASPEVGLQTHINDIANLIQWNDLQDVILVGHSYGGLVIGGVADALADKIRALVFVDALLPEDGRSAMDYQTAERAEYLRARAHKHDGWRLPPISAVVYGVDDPEKAQWVDGKCVAHPLATFEDAQKLTGAWQQVASLSYIRCTQSGLDYMDRFSEHAAAAPNWRIHYIPTGHDCMVTEPDHLAALLMTEG
ncbi:MAG: alpha/beta hydrolase [Alphaproteobacteria bacterium]|jgi:pimeloyl-ACP methyl ester carboxylesterase|nr:alpha/beta hydrolase [Alphaproteobacteria bacterium]MBT4020567.1 alpha/beta hydrolase [Alphaproteobacteria bacterium]MBT4964882.1 alpha/beta hydrolase [Alphaproteobacteria bacterium]MBT5161626.1 alpha/beta hydrolase [Alphaproteobacteria bacterium]MBT5918608.1 alpha/beta hydrolase [Alphaproteobacteria bacterium]